MIKCAVCGKEFHAKPSAVKNGKKYCSKECYDKFQFKGEIKACATCGKEIRVAPSNIRERNFCSNECRLVWLSKYVTEEINVKGHAAGVGKAGHSAGHKAPHLTEYNRTKNPMNQPDSEQRRECYKKTPEELHQIRVGAALKKNGGRYKKDTYKKIGNRHEHRVVAEAKLGRRLQPGEVVHHIDGNKRNNNPENLMVFANQALHSQWHAKHDNYLHKGGGAKCQ